MRTAEAIAAAFLVSATALSAQGPIINRMAPATLRGTIVEVTCFRQQGAATDKAEARRSLRD